LGVREYSTSYERLLIIAPSLPETQYLESLFGTVVYKHVAGHIKIRPIAPVLHQSVAQQQHLELFALVFHGLSVAVRQVQGQHGQFGMRCS
jgi:hypothetical protein